MGKTTDNHQELRKHVIDVTIKEFRKKGIKSVTMDDVAHLLAMSKRTLYQLFSDKEDLLMACMMESFRREEEAVAEFLKTTDNVLEILLHIFQLKIQETGSFSPAFLFDLHRYPRIVEFLRKRKERSMTQGIAFMQRGKEQGVFKSDIDFDIVFAFLLNKDMDYVVENEAIRNKNLREIFYNTVMLIIRGCTTPKGTVMLDDFVEKLKQESRGRE